MVEKEVAAVVNLAHIRRRLPHSPANGQEQQPRRAAESHDEGRHPPPGAHPPPRVGQAARHEPGNQMAEKQREDHPKRQPRGHEQGRNAGEGIGGRVGVVEECGVELVVPERIDGGIGHKGQFRGENRQINVRPEHRAQRKAPRPQAQEQQEQRKGRQVSRHGGVEPEAVEHDLGDIARPVARRRLRRVEEEERFLQSLQHDKSRVEAEKGKDAFFHSQSLGQNAAQI